MAGLRRLEMPGRRAWLRWQFGGPVGSLVGGPVGGLVGGLVGGPVCGPVGGPVGLPLRRGRILEKVGTRCSVTEPKVRRDILFFKATPYLPRYVSAPSPCHLELATQVLIRERSARMSNSGGIIIRISATLKEGVIHHSETTIAETKASENRIPVEIKEEVADEKQAMVENPRIRKMLDLLEECERGFETANESPQEIDVRTERLRKLGAECGVLPNDSR
ncbi:hypothetical protein QBC39DRAFT_349070, partial [Podospora conica]